jgi:WhiB family transcriptional regulator, redox-sensing transcriptional regulator
VTTTSHLEGRAYADSPRRRATRRPGTRPGGTGRLSRADTDPDLWRESAACRYVDPELFFPLSSTGRGAADAQRAKAICAGCPVRQRCLAFALATGQEFGIWGGYDEAELRALHREQHLAGRADRAGRTLPA